MLAIVVAIMLQSGELVSNLATNPSKDPDKGSDLQRSETEEIARLVAQQFAAWNRRDIDGYMKVFWGSPLLIFAVEGEVWIGWDQVKANLLQEYSDPERMGNSVLDRLQTNIVSPETAMTVEWWSMMFRTSKVSGFTTSAWHKFPVGWRIIQGHTSVLEMR
jgi:uncharacterized protein (TIGR02246 family)